MRRKISLSLFLLVSGYVAASAALLFPGSTTQRTTSSLHANSLCTADEQVIFSCSLKRSAKIVSLCSSKDFAKDSGYLQYRFGLPGKIELKFPKDRKATQQQFRYSHYFRYQVDLTEITFKNDDFEYVVFDNYNGEEKTPISEQGVTVTPLPPAKPIDVTLTCAGKPKVDYGKLEDALANTSDYNVLRFASAVKVLIPAPQ
ncbi:MAG: uncharacterized protein JWM21_1041 [Acidobacteria bacterium]|nr:uncharacterized protein [Acidobacteriota bacterium]